MNEAVQLGNDYVALGGSTSPADKDLYDTWFTSLKVIFFSNMLENYEEGTNKEVFERIDIDQNMGEEKNAEILHLWYQLCIKSGYHTAPYKIEDDFLGSIGRMKFVVPIYSTLNDVSREDAQRIYAGH